MATLPWIGSGEARFGGTAISLGNTTNGSAYFYLIADDRPFREHQFNHRHPSFLIMDTEAVMTKCRGVPNGTGDAISWANWLHEIHLWL